MHAFVGGHEATGKSRISALLTFNLSFKFRFTVAFFVLMLVFRLTFSFSYYNYALLCSIGVAQCSSLFSVYL